MAKEEKIEVRGRVEKTERTGFNIKLEGQDTIVFCTAGGKLRKHSIRILTGDYVDIELSPYDLTKGRIVFRHNTCPDGYKG